MLKAEGANTAGLYGEGVSGFAACVDDLGQVGEQAVRAAPVVCRGSTQCECKYSACHLLQKEAISIMNIMLYEAVVSFIESLMEGRQRC